jgi:cytochrome c-type biogenesis protein CcmH/NrfG
MNHPTTSTQRATSDMLGRLALPRSASSQTIEVRYEALVDFLGSAPADLRGWANRMTADIDEAFASLSDPDLTLDHEPTVAAVGTPPVAPSPLEASTSRRRWMPVAAVLAGAGLVVGVYLVGRGGSAVPGITGSPTDQTSASAVASVDTAKVGELMQKISANPKDVASLQALGDLYFTAGDYPNAAQWESKILALEPNDITALLSLGAARYNQGDAAQAEKLWQKVVALDPNQQEAHYDLGFLYLSQTPADNAKVLREWNKVIAINPSTEIAKTVSTHLASLASPSASADAAPSAK